VLSPYHSGGLMLRMLGCVAVAVVIIGLLLVFGVLDAII
jgi:hypothetical protein